MKEVAKELEDLQAAVRDNQDSYQRQRRRILSFLPRVLHAAIESCIGFLGSDLGIEAREFGICAFPFGKATVIALPHDDDDMEIEVVGSGDLSTQV